MRLTNGADWLDLVAAPPPSGFEGAAIDPDVLLNVSFHVNGFGGADQSWVERADWNGFLEEFTTLEASRRGEAELLGENPDEFRLRFYVYGSVGHTAVDGLVARKSGRGHEAFGAKLEFQMPFEPDQLLPALREFRSYTKARA